MERELEDVIRYSKQKAYTIAEFRKVHRELRSIRLFDLEMGMRTKEKVQRYQTYAGILNSYFNIAKDWDTMLKGAKDRLRAKAVYYTAYDYKVTNNYRGGEYLKAVWG